MCEINTGIEPAIVNNKSFMSGVPVFENRSYASLAAPTMTATKNAYSTGINKIAIPLAMAPAMKWFALSTGIRYLFTLYFYRVLLYTFSRLHCFDLSVFVF